MANEKNLIPNNLRSPQEVRENGSKGGKKSGKVRKEKKLMSQIYAGILAKKYKTDLGQLVQGSEIMEKVVMGVLKRGDSSSVSMMREIREATEGNKVHVGGDDDNPITINLVGVKPFDSNKNDPTT